MRRFGDGSMWLVGLAGLVWASSVLAQVECPSSLPVPQCGATAVTVTKRGHETLPPGVYGALRVKNGGRLTLEGGHYVFCSIKVARNGEIRFGDASSIEVGGNVMFANATAVGPASGVSPCDVDLAVSGEIVSMQRNADVGLRLCAPNADVRVANGVHFIGRIVAGQSHVHRADLEDCPEGPSTTTTTIRVTTTTSTTVATTTTTVPASTTTTTTVPTTTTTTTPVSTTTTTTVATTTTTIQASTTTTTVPTTTTTVQGSTTTTLATTTTTTTVPTTTTTTLASTTTSSTVATTTTTSTTAIPTTTTSTTTSTTTTTVGAVCGNGSVESPGETCDDGNTVDENTVDPLPPDPCPANCRIETCDAPAGTLAVDVNFASTASIAGYKIFLNYPEGKLSIPGVGQPGAGIITNDPTFSATANDLDYGIIVVAGGISAIQPSRLLTVNFTRCGGAPVVAGDFNCIVKQSSDPNGNDVPMTCSVSLLP